MYGGTFTFYADGGGKSCNQYYRGPCSGFATVKIQYGNLEYLDTMSNFQKHCKALGIPNPLVLLPPDKVTQLTFNNYRSVPSFYCDYNSNNYCDTRYNIQPFEDLKLPVDPFVNVLANLEPLVQLSNEQALNYDSGYFPVNATNTNKR